MSYRIRNWSEYNAGLKQRGSLTFWLDEAVLKQWIIEDLSGKPGASVFYSDLAITTMVTLKAVYQLAGRQCQGFVESIFELMGIDLPVPDHSTLSRRFSQLSISMPVVPKSGARHIVLDSTGVKVYGEGEWKTRQHGVSKRRTWRLLHLGVDEETGAILMAVASTNDISDGEVLADIQGGIEGETLRKFLRMEPMTSVNATMRLEHAKPKPRFLRAREPRFGSMATVKPSVTTVTRTCAEFALVGRKAWKRESNYHRRSLAETTMFRFKTIFGGKLSSRNFDNQAVELFIKCAALNRMIQIAKPDSYEVDA